MRTQVDETSWRPGRKETNPANRRLRSVRVTAAYLLFGGALAAAAVGGLLGPWRPIAFLAVALTTIVALTVSVWIRRPAPLWPWVLITVAFVLFLAGGLARYRLATLGDLSAGRSLLPDLVVLPGYLLLAAGLLGFAHHSSSESHRRWSVVLDALIAGLAALAIAWVFAIRPLLAQDPALPATVVLILYPALSIAMLVVTLRIAFNPEQERMPAYWLLLAGMSWMFIGDVVYLLADANLLAIPAALLDLPYTLALLAAGATALHPTMRRLSQPGRPSGRAAPRGRIVLVAIALAVPAVLNLSDRATSLADRLVLSVLMLAVTAVAVVRIVQALQTAYASEARLVFQAYHDGLTALPNRQLMERQLARLLEEARLETSHVALLYIDLDRFKAVNDSLGHRRGDELLIEVAGRLRDNVRPTDIVTRIGGDEFMVLLGDVVGVARALELANRLRACLSEPFLIAGRTFSLSASIGLAYASGDDPSVTVESLVRDADAAMYQAKDAGRDAVAVFDESLRLQVERRLAIERDLPDAVAAGQLHLVYQPIVGLPDGNALGVEALVRWSHPRQGVIGPAGFIPFAEQNGCIGEIGAWVLAEALGQLATWRRDRPAMAELYVSVNLSGAQLYDEQIVAEVAEALAAHGLPGSALCLELTESVVMDDAETAAEVLRSLRGLGVAIAIDDFGSAYSSLAYLKRFPASILKIDRAFIGNLATPEGLDGTLVATILDMAEALAVATIAEGVEHRDQERRLIELGCDAVQGYLYSRPVGADRLPAVIGSLATQQRHFSRSGVP